MSEKDLLTQLANVEREKKFRVQNKALLLTYKTHIDKDDLYEKLSSFCKNKYKIYIAHENGVGDEITPYEHTHVAIDFGDNFQSTNCRIFDWDGIHPNIQKIGGRGKGLGKEWKIVCKYVTKEDKTIELAKEDIIEDEKTMIQRVEMIQKCDNLTEALKMGMTMSEINAIKTIYEANRRRPKWEYLLTPLEFLEVDKWKPFQQDLKKITETKPDDRSVYWIHDTKGHQGKNSFLKWAVKLHGKKYMDVKVMSLGDIMMGIGQEVYDGWEGDTILINLTRTLEDRVTLYQLIEEIKDQIIRWGKFNGGKVVLKLCHVLVFSNELPRFDMLSEDRWIVKQIIDGEFYEYRGGHNINRPLIMKP